MKKDKMVTFYVSPSGSDDWSGRMPEKDVNDGPLATLAAARDLARKHKGCPVRIELRGGIYELEDTLVLSPADSRTEDAPVTYGAYAGERPVISGGRLLEGWQEVDVEGQRRWTLSLPEVANGQWYFTQLFLNGERRHRPRLPKEGFYRFTGLPDGHRTFDFFGATTRAEYKSGDIQAWKNREDVRIVALQHWYDTHLQIASLDEANQMVTFASRCVGDLQDEEDRPARYYLDNVGEALSEPGEWYLDRESGTLTYLPLKGETIETAQVVAPRLDFLVKVMGRVHEGEGVAYINFENIDFVYAEWDLPPECPGAVQSAFNVPAALHFQGAEHCSLYGCRVAHISQYAVEFLAGSRHNKVIGCHLHDLGAGGVKIGHEGWKGAPNQGEDSFLGLDREALGVELPGAPNPLPGKDPVEGGCHLISDCHIHHGGIRYHSAVGVWVGNSGFNRVCHNEIHDFNYTAISSGWNWHFGPTYTIGNRLDYNHIYNIGMGVLSDMGAIYALGRHPGGTMIGNHIHDVYCNGYGGCGIYPDQGSSFWRIEDNVVHHTQSAALSLHFGLSLQVRNNIFACTDSSAMGRGREESVRAMTIEHNLIYQTHAEMIAGFSVPTSHFAHNLYFNANDNGYGFSRNDWAAWCQIGHDQGSRLVDPLFADPEHGDFAVRDDSPAFAMGIKVPDASKAGPRLKGRRPRLLSDWPDEPQESEPIFDIWLAPGEPIYPTLDDLMQHLTNPSVAFIPSGQPTTVSVTVHNVGKRAATRTFKLQSTPVDAATIIGDAEKTLSLEPGERKAITFELLVAPDADNVCFEVVGDHADVPTVAQDFKPQRDVAIPRIEALKSEPLSILPEILSKQEPELIGDNSGKPAGLLKMASDGSSLYILADVRDEKVEHVPDPCWVGSCLHCFGPGAGVFAKHRWLMLQPAASGHDAAVRMMNMTTFKIEGPVADVCVESHPTDQGYQLMARIPYPLLEIAGDPQTLELEFHLDTQTEGKRQNYKLFGGLNAWIMGMDGFGRIHIEDRNR